MKYIIRKFVDAETVQDAIKKDRRTPVHDCYLKDGEHPKDERLESAIGFSVVGGSEFPYELKRKR